MTDLATLPPFDPEDPPESATQLDRRSLALAAWRWSRGQRAWQNQSETRAASDRAFEAWWDGELYPFVRRASLRLLCQAAWNASVARPDEYEPGDGFSRWWRSLVEEAQLAYETAAETAAEVIATAPAELVASP